MKRRMAGPITSVFFTTSVLAFAASLAACGDDNKEQQRSELPELQVGDFKSVEECEAYWGQGACEPEKAPVPAPVLMTAENRPSFSSKADCERQFGVGNCELPGSNGELRSLTADDVPGSAITETARQQVSQTTRGGGGGVVYQPIFIPGNTYFYPYGAYSPAFYGNAVPSGYYNNTPRSSPPPSVLNPPSRPSFRPASTIVNTRMTQAPFRPATTATAGRTQPSAWSSTSSVGRSSVSTSSSSSSSVGRGGFGGSGSSASSGG